MYGTVQCQRHRICSMSFNRYRRILDTNITIKVLSILTIKLKNDVSCLVNIKMLICFTLKHSTQMTIASIQHTPHTILLFSKCNNISIKWSHFLWKVRANLLQINKSFQGLIHFGISKLDWVYIKITNIHTPI